MLRPTPPTVQEVYDARMEIRSLIDKLPCNCSVKKEMKRLNGLQIEKLYATLQETEQSKRQEFWDLARAYDVGFSDLSMVHSKSCPELTEDEK